MFPGNRDITINDMKDGNCKFDRYDYIMNSVIADIGSYGSYRHDSNLCGVWMAYQDGEGLSWEIQSANQWLTFRIRDAYNGTYFYSSKNDVAYSGGSNSSASDNIFDSPLLSARSNKTYWPTTYTPNRGMVIYPLLSDASALQLDGDSVYSRLTLAPGEAVVVPLNIDYKVLSGTVKKTISFDLRPSLYNDPSTYVVEFNAFNVDTVQTKTARKSKKHLLSRTMLVNTSANSASTLQSQQLVEAAARYKTTIKNQ
jgi:hypothetical protein